VLVVGPGLEPAPSQFVERLLEGFGGPMVIDAGAIGAITRLDTLLEREAPTVLTPHAGEFHRLTGVEASYEEAMRLSDATGAIVLLKGNPTFVAGRDLVVVDAGGPELASIGTGDVLAGVIAALLASGLEPGLAAAMGAHIHARAAADLAGSTVVTSSDLVDAVGAVAARGMGEPIR
jgi:NAD(P)H-hydrate epimerase